MPQANPSHHLTPSIAGPKGGLADRPGLSTVEPNELYIGYALDAEIRSVAASGGLVSGVLVHLLEQGRVQAAVVSRIGAADGTIQAVTELACTRAEVLACAGSSYIDTPVVRRVKALRDYPGRLAVVALPCQVRQLRRLMARDALLQERVYAIVSLFCRGTVTPQFYEDYFARMGIDPGAVESVKVTRSHIRGTVSVRLRDGDVRSLKFQQMNAYRIAGFHAKPLCLWCDEHLGAEADIAVGDIFAPGVKDRPIKHSALICRTPVGVQVVEEMLRAQRLTLEHFGLHRYRTQFASNERFSNNLGPRSWPARLMRLGRGSGRRGWVNPFQMLAWALYFLSFHATRFRRGRRIVFRLPHFLISAWALLIKLLSRM